VGLAKEPLSSPDLGTAVELGKALHSTYVLFGAADKQDGALKLRVKIVKVADGSVFWSRSYAGAGADTAKIAADINANLPQLTE
jgi:TolB-like protein